MNKETHPQPDIKSIISTAEGLAGGMTSLAKDLGMTRQALYSIIQKGRCRMTTRLLLKQYIMLVKLGHRKKKEKMRKGKVYGRSTTTTTKSRRTTKATGGAGKGDRKPTGKVDDPGVEAQQA